MFKKEIVVLISATAIALAISLAVLWYALKYFRSVSPDLQLVELDTKVPPFFEQTLPLSALQPDFLLKEPLTSVRGGPFYAESANLGPHDVLGFRNRGVPHVARIITIGDSMTYGINVPLADSWPAVLARELKLHSNEVYSMALGGWGAVQYLSMAEKARLFRPKVLVVALYSGNDALESFRDAYGLKQYADLRPDPSLSIKDMPAAHFPPRPEEVWTVRFSSGGEVSFTPLHRFISNDRESAVVRAGFGIVKSVLLRLAALAEKEKTSIVVTVIPTKELVYWRRLLDEGAKLDPIYEKLVTAEEQNIRDLERTIRSQKALQYVEVVSALQQAATKHPYLYPPDSNGHPLVTGYALIARLLAAQVKGLLGGLETGLMRVNNHDGKSLYYLLCAGKFLMAPLREVVQGNGWSVDQARQVEYRDIAYLDVSGTLREIDPKRFGPSACQ